MVKYRLQKVTKASGFTLWVIQKKTSFPHPFFWLWDYADSYVDKSKAMEVLQKLKSGVPEETRETIDE